MAASSRLATFAAALALAIGFLAAPAVEAAPVAKPAAAPAYTPTFEDKVIKVQRWRRGRRWRGRRWRGGPRWRRRGRGWGTGIAIGGAILGAIILSEAAKAQHRRSGAWERCAERYRSFDHETGTIVTYDGDVILCPYLR